METSDSKALVLRTSSTQLSPYATYLEDARKILGARPPAMSWWMTTTSGLGGFAARYVFGIGSGEGEYRSFEKDLDLRLGVYHPELAELAILGREWRILTKTSVTFSSHLFPSLVSQTVLFSDPVWNTCASVFEVLARGVLWIQLHGEYMYDWSVVCSTPLESLLSRESIDVSEALPALPSSEEGSSKLVVAEAAPSQGAFSMVVKVRKAHRSWHDLPLHFEHFKRGITNFNNPDEALTKIDRLVMNVVIVWWGMQDGFVPPDFLCRAVNQLCGMSRDIKAALTDNITQQLAGVIEWTVAKLQTRAIGGIPKTLGALKCPKPE